MLKTNFRFISEKPFHLIGHITYLILFLLAGLFYIERMIYSDAAFYLFKMIHFDKLNIEFGRYSIILYEMPAFLSIKLGLSLHAITFIFSVTTIAVSYGAFLLCLYYFKNLACSYTVLFLNFIGVACSFFYPMSESYIGLIFSLLLFAWLEKRVQYKLDFKTIIFGTTFIAVCFLSHPGVYTVLIFLIFYHLLKNRNWNNFNVYILTFVIIVGLLVKYFQVQQNSYESGVISNLVNVKDFLSNILDSPSFKAYFMYLFRVYYLNHIILIFSIVIFVKRKQYMMLTYYCLAYIGMLFLLLVLYHKGESSEMIEKGFLPLTIFLTLPILNELFSYYKNKYYLISIIISIIILLSTVRIIDISKDYVKHINYLDKITREASAPKSIMYLTDENRRLLRISWAVGVETLLYTSLEGPEKSRTIFFIEKDEKLDSSFLTDPNTFLCVKFWPYWDSRELNNTYFKLPEEKYSFQEEN